MRRHHLFGVPITKSSRKKWISAATESELAFASASLHQGADALRVAKHAVLGRIEAAIERVTNKSLGLLHFIAIASALAALNVVSKSPDQPFIEQHHATYALLILLFDAAILLLNLMLAWPAVGRNVSDIDAEIWDVMKLARIRGLRLTLANWLAMTAVIILLTGLRSNTLGGGLTAIAGALKWLAATAIQTIGAIEKSLHAV